MSVRKLRLCVLTPVHSSTLMGGAEYQINCLLETLVPTGRYEIHYLAAAASTDSQPHGYRIVPVGNGDGMPRFGFLMHAKPLLRTLKELRPDVIYQRVACGYTGLAALLRAPAWNPADLARIERQRCDALEPAISVAIPCVGYSRIAASSTESGMLVTS